MVGMDGFCMNCGHDTTNEMDLMYEDEEVTSLHDMSEVDFGEEDWVPKRSASVAETSL